MTNYPSDPPAASEPPKAIPMDAPISWVQRLRDRDNTNRVIALLLLFIAFVLAFYFIQTASLLLIPITFAWLLSTLFHPLVHTAERWKIPSVISAGIIMGMFTTGVVWLILMVLEPATDWLRELPAVLRELQMKLGSMQGALSEIEALTREVDQLANLEGEQRTEAIAVQIKEQNLVRSIITDHIPVALTSAAIIVFLTFFLLASGDGMLRRMTRLGSNLATRRRIVRAVHSIRTGVAHYLATVTVINFSLGIVVTLLMMVLGVPNPLLWGMLAGIVNFAPYLGPAVTIVILFLVGITSFDTLGAALMVPFSFFIVTTLEGQLITPMIVGKRLALSPATVFISVVVWGWLWGVAGALMAVPIVASLKIIFENIPALEGIARKIDEP